MAVGGWWLVGDRVGAGVGVGGLGGTAKKLGCSEEKRSDGVWMCVHDVRRRTRMAKREEGACRS